MRTIILNIAFLVIVLFMISCDEDYFYEEIDLDELEYVDLLTATAEYYEGDSLLNVYISRTLPPDVTGYPPVENGDYRVVVSNDNGDILLSDTCQDCNQLTLDVDGIFNRASSYSMQVTDLENGDQIIARASFPEKPNVNLLNTTFSDTDRELLFSIEINDLKDNKDYYFFDQIYVIEDPSRPRNIYFYPPEHLETYFENTKDYDRILPDESFEGQRFLIPLREYYQSSSTEDSATVSVITENWSENYYRYGKSLFSIEESEYNPFIEPVSVRGNFENGLGIFTLITRDTASVKFAL